MAKSGAQGAETRVKLKSAILANLRIWDWWFGPSGSWDPPDLVTSDLGILRIWTLRILGSSGSGPSGSWTLRILDPPDLGWSGSGV